MANTREIVTKAVVGKGKKNFVNTMTVKPEFIPNTILGCWIINHNFKGIKKGNKIDIEGSYDVNIWYSCDGDSRTEVVKDKHSYKEEVNIPNVKDDDITNEDVIIRSLKQPSCIKCDIVDGKIEYTVEKELGIEIVGDVKVKIAYDEEEDPWDSLNDDQDIKERENVNDKIDSEVNEEYLK